MSGKIDRRIGDNRLLVWSLLAVFAVAAGVFVWLRFGVPAPLQQQASRTLSLPAHPARPDEPLTITLYYPLNGMLVAGPVAIKRQPEAQAQAREALAALFTGPGAAQDSIFREVRLRELFLDASGTAYADLSSLQQSGVRAPAREELLAVYAIVDTLTQNFEEIKRVRILLEGKEAQTLAGHIDLTGKFEKRMDLVKQ